MINLRKIAENINRKGVFAGQVEFDAPLKDRTTFKVGGAAGLLVEPEDVPSLCAALEAVRAEAGGAALAEPAAGDAGTAFAAAPAVESAIPAAAEAALPFVLGGGSNLVVADGGIPGVVLSLSKLRGVSVEPPDEGAFGGAGTQAGAAGAQAGVAFAGASGTQAGAAFAGGERILLKCLAGTPIQEVTAFCAKRGYTGFEAFAGLPGTVGGAVFMNARCYDVEVSDVLVSAGYIPLGADSSVPEQPVAVRGYRMRDAAPGEWDYKRSPFQHELYPAVITEAVFALFKGEAAQVAARCERYRRDRVEKGHFRYPSAGSVFKNNRAYGKPSGKIIDEAGLKGVAVGGAQVAPWHGNFIVNTGGATASDIKELVALVRRVVKEKSGFELEPEIIFTDGMPLR